MITPLPELTDDDRSRYEWQMWIEGFGETGQRKVKAATAFISRGGGVGGTAAYYLAAAGIGRLVLAHGGDLRSSDLNRQLLMTHDWLGKPRIESAVRRLRAYARAAEPDRRATRDARRTGDRRHVHVSCEPS